MQRSSMRLPAEKENLKNILWPRATLRRGSGIECVSRIQMYYCRFLILFLLGAVAGAQAPSPAGAQGDRSSQKPTAATERERTAVDPLLDLPPLPESRVTLVGGTIAKLDRVRDRIVVRPFGGREMTIAFDQRTKTFRDGVAVDVRELRAGSHVYVDTLFDGSRIFATNIRIRTKENQGDARGQVVAYDSNRGVLEVREVSSVSLSLRVTPQTSVRIDERSAAVSDIRVGSLIAINFAPGPANAAVAREIRILATPGQIFTFAGTITFVDLRLRRIAVTNQSDQTSYEISVGSIPSAAIRGVEEGTNATIRAVFDGQHYEAKSIDVTAPSPRTPSNTEN